MKNILLLFSLCLAMLLAGCDVEDPKDKDLYPQKVYIVGTQDQVINRDVDLGNVPDTISISVAVSGSLTLSHDVTVTFGEEPAEVGVYNERNVSAEAVHYQQPDASLYTYPLDQLTIKAGTVYNTFPIRINPSTLNCDSLYMIPLRLKSISDYELSPKDTIVLVKLNLTNKYAGLYYVDGVLKNTTNPKDSLIYKMSRNLVASDNGSTVRMYHYTNETKDYRSANAFRITINSDNSLSYSTWDQFEIYDGGGTYYPDVEVYEFWYEYNKSGTRWRASGFLYQERTTKAEQDILEDWLEEHKK
jgi:hypothetical protein